MNEIAVNTEGEEERRKPFFRSEVRPTTRVGHSYLSAMYRWGFNSLTLFRRLNEDPGPWWNANSATLVSDYSQIGDTTAAGMWSGVWRYTFGQGEHNLRPYQLRMRTFGRKERAAKGKPGSSIAIDYDETITKPPQMLLFPHTKEHAQHRRVKNPPLPGFKDIESVHGKRILREVQYHLGQGLRFYLVDGIFGSHPDTSTAFRVITDNPTSAYLTSISSHRKCNFVSSEELLLTKRLKQAPMDEWAWRRPGVVVYHAPGFDFEAPRITEEFGGPRPQDLSLEHPKFIALEPYSIPMKGIIAAEPKHESLLKTLGFLCARWGFYADSKHFLTVEGDSVLSPNGKRLTVVISSGGVSLDPLKASPYLYGCHHHRLDDKNVSRAWDLRSAPAVAASHSPLEVVETAQGRVHAPLTTRLGCAEAVSHRLLNRRRVSEFGYKRPHNYTADPATRADQGGHLFNGAPRNTLKAHHVRPAAVPISDVCFIVVSPKASPQGPPAAAAAQAVVDDMQANSWLYAESAALAPKLEAAFAKAQSVKIVSGDAVLPLLAQLSKKGEE
jgi:hypothetical protein